MCCRCPPSVGVFSYIYILLTVIVTFYFQHAKSIYLKELRYANIDGIQNHNYLMSEEFNINLQIPIGNEFMGLNDLHPTNLDTDAIQTSINNKSFCEIMDNYIYHHIGEYAQRPVSPCPDQSGSCQIYDNHPGFNDVAIQPLEMPTRKTFRLELIRHAEKIACKQFQFINGGRDNGFLEENDV